MRQSKLFGKTLREDPRDEIASNAKFLERGGFVYKTMAGVYDYLPLGWRILENINRIIREEMDAIGGQELFLSAFQPRERWEKTGRWESAQDVMFRIEDASRRIFGLGFTHEEAIAEIATRSIFSYRDLPLFVYQIQTKFRDEPRAKSGLIRTREFLMKDLYSFHANKNDLEKFYTTADRAYRNVFKRCGVNVFFTEAPGGTFTKESTHEYQVLSDAGEDWILYCTKCNFSQNKEISSLKEGSTCQKCGGMVKSGKSIEVGNIFKLGTKFSEAFGLFYADERGIKHPVVMGSYGIGPGRLMATVVETHHDEKGIIWPESVAPYKVHLIVLQAKDAVLNKKVRNEAEKLYNNLLAKGTEVLYDDRDDKTAGEKFADADLIGIPWRVVVSEKTVQKKSIEMKARSSQTSMLVSFTALIKKLKS